MGTDLQGPLSSMWRSVYRKAAQVAEGRTDALVKDHVYLFHRTLMGGGAGPWVDEAGDTMSGALVMRLPAPYDAGAQHGYGAATGAFTPASTGTSTQEVGLRFSHPTGGTLLAVRWYRAATGASAPASVRLWDTTATGAAVWSVTGLELEPFLDPAVGWKTAVFDAPPALVAGRQYVVSFQCGTTIWLGVGYTPVPDAPLVVVAHVHALIPETFPNFTGADAYLLDPVVGTPADLPPAATTGAIRLQNGEPGRIAWRNGADDGDNWLGVDASDALLYNGLPVGGGGAEVTITPDASLTSVESPANTFALAVRLSPDAGNALSLHANGLYGTDTSGGGLATDPLADAKGDLFAASANNAVGRLPAGTNGQVLTVDSAEALGVKWAAASAGGAYLPLSGGTLTGSLKTTVLTAVSPTTATTSRVFGASSPAFAPVVGSGTYELGVMFRSPTPVQLTALRWHRATGATATPAAVRVWDTTSTGAPLYTLTAGEVTPFADAAVGWKTATLTSPIGLVGGRDYVVSYTTPAQFGYHGGYTPIPDSPLVYVSSQRNTVSAGSYPNVGGSDFYSLDAAVEVAATASALSGAVRLANATAVAWRNAGNTADLALTVSSGNALTFDGSPVAVGSFLPLVGGTLTGDLVVSEATPTVSLKQAADTQPRSRLTDTALGFGPGGSTAPDATLARTGAGALRVDSHLGVGIAPSAWGGPNSALQAQRAALVGSAAGATFAYNGYYDGTTWRAVGADSAFKFDLIGNTFAIGNAPAVAAGAAQTFTTRAAIGATGTLTLTQDAGQPAVLGGTGTALRLEAPSPQNVSVASGGGFFHPVADNTTGCGYSALRWTVVYAAAGAISTSSRTVKEGITPLDPARAMQAVRDTEAVTFDYVAPTRGPDYYDLPDDPEQAEQVLTQRLRSAPLEAAARHQAGFVSEDADPLFLVGEGQTSPSHTAGILFAALQQLDQRVSALEGN